MYSCHLLCVFKSRYISNCTLKVSFGNRLYFTFSVIFNSSKIDSAAAGIFDFHNKLCCSCQNVSYIQFKFTVTVLGIRTCFPFQIQNEAVVETLKAIICENSKSISVKSNTFLSIIKLHCSK